MRISYRNYILSDEKELLQPERLLELLIATPWAKHYTMDTIRGIIEYSVCMGVYYDGIQVGFARCVTDYTDRKSVV